MKYLYLAMILILAVTVSGCGGGGGNSAYGGIEATTLIDYPVAAGATGGDLSSRAFYITSYPGTTLSKVTLYLCGEYSTEDYTIRLEAHDSTFDGTLIGTATASFSGVTSPQVKATTFDFGNAAVTTTHVVAFKISVVSGNGNVFFGTDGDTGGGTSIVHETENSDPPLSTDRRNVIGIKVTGRKSSTF